MSLQDRLEPLILQLPGKAGIVVARDLGNPLFLWREKEIFPAASLIKLFILWELFRRHDIGDLDLEQRVTLQAQDKVAGFGVLKELGDGLQPRLKDLAILMIILSDNVATNILLKLLGMSAVNEVARNLGAEGSILSRCMMDAAAKARGLENFTTPMDITRFLQGCLTSTALSAASRAEIVRILGCQQCNNKLPTGLPLGTMFAHKTGDLTGIEHDAGILYTPSGPVIVTVLTRDLADNAIGIAFHQQVAAALWQELG